MASPIADHIIDTAGALFYSEGTQSVGVDRIIQEAGIAKATMYRHFSGKEALIIACLQRRNERVLEALMRGLEQVPARGDERILAMYDLLYDKADSPDFRGCAFMLAVAENESSELVRAVARKHKQAVLDLFLSLLPPTLARRERMAAQLNLLYDGAMAQILISRRSDPARVARECAQALLELSALRH